MTINDLIEQLQRLPMKDRPIYIERSRRDQFDRKRTDAYPCPLLSAGDEGPYAVIRPSDKWTVRD